MATSFSSDGRGSAASLGARQCAKRPVAAASGMSQITRASYRLFKELRPPQMNAFSTMPANKTALAARHLFSASVSRSDLFFLRNLGPRNTATTNTPSRVARYDAVFPTTTKTLDLAATVEVILWKSEAGRRS